MKKLILSISIMLLISACRTDSTSYPFTGLHINADSSVILFDSVDSIHPDKDAAAINAVSLTGTILDINVSYSGGCKDHVFKLYIWEGFSKSNPPQAEVFLSHNANGDGCEAYITQDYLFDLTGYKNFLNSNYPEIEKVFLRIYPPDASEPFEPLIELNL